MLLNHTSQTPTPFQNIAPMTPPFKTHILTLLKHIPYTFTPPYTHTNKYLQNQQYH